MRYNPLPIRQSCPQASTHYIARQYTINQEIINSKSVTKLKVNTNVLGGCYRRPKTNKSQKTRIT